MHHPNVAGVDTLDDDLAQQGKEKRGSTIREPPSNVPTLKPSRVTREMEAGRRAWRSTMSTRQALCPGEHDEVLVEDADDV